MNFRLRLLLALLPRTVLAGFLTALLLSLAACDSQTPEKPEIIILQTGRLRGNIYPLSLQHLAPLQHYPYIAGYVEAVRQEAAKVGAEVLLIDLGDSLEGSFASYVTDSANVTEFFKLVGYDAVVLGNLDSDLPPEIIAELPPLRLNPFTGPKGQETYPGTSAVGILPAIGKRRIPIYFLANFYGDTAVEEFPDRFPTSFGLVSSGAHPVRSYRNLIENWGGRPANALTLFAWLKFEAPPEPPEKFLKNLRAMDVDAILAQRVYGSRERDVWSEADFPGWEPPVLQNILRNNGGFTLARMDLRREGNNWKVLRRELVPMTANSAAPSQKAIELIERFAPQIENADETVRQLEEPVEEMALLWSVLRSLTALPGAEAVVYSPQSIRAPLPKGTLRASQLFNSLPWTTPLLAMQVTPEEIDLLSRVNGRMEFWQRLPEEAPTPSASPEPAPNKEPSASGEPSLPSSNIEPDDHIELVTSRYFLPIFERQLGRTIAAREVAPSDFGNFLQFLKNDPTALDLRLPPGWQRISPPLPPEAPGT